MPEHRFVFICGLHRSGTSLLFQCLRQHPLISGFSETGVPEDEGQHLQSVFPTAMDHGGPGRFGFSYRAHLTDDSPLAKPENRRKLLSQWEPYWDLQKPFLLEKSPPNLIRTRFLQKLFPNAAFIILTRHPVAVSLATSKWTRTSMLHTLLRHWLICHETFRDDSPFLERFRVMKYEHFVTDPQGCLDKLYDFLGIEPHPVEARVRTNINQRYFARWEKGLRLPLVRRYLHHVSLKYEKRVNAFGYSLTDLERLDPEPAQLAV